MKKNHGSFNELDFNKALEGKTLLSQPWIKDTSITVEDYLHTKVIINCCDIYYTII